MRDGGKRTVPIAGQKSGAWWACAAAILACGVAVAGVGGMAGRAVAQDPTIADTQSSTPKTFGDGSPISNLVQPDTTQPLNLEGDELIYDSAGQTVTARGNVEILFNNYVLKADEVTYDQNAGNLTAIGNVVLREPGGVVTRSERITLSDDFRNGFVESLSVVAKDESRITARRAVRRDGNVSVFEDGKFTPCKTRNGNPPLWCLAASKVTHDQSEATISYEDVEFQVFGQTILWLPYFQHADPSVKRKSGFLQPSFSHSDNLGYVAGVPYYFALAPNYDFTFHPLYTSKQGTLWQGTWRHKVAFAGIRGEYSASIAALDQDVSNLDVSDANDDLDGWRGSFETRGDFSLSSWWKFGWDATIESDSTFRRFYKLDGVLTTTRVNSAHLIGQSERNYLSIYAYHFGSLQFSDTPVAESQVHPVVDYNYIVDGPVLGGELSFNANAVSLSRDLRIEDEDVISSQQRASVEINWRRKLTDRVGITYTPFANLRGDVISLTDNINAATLDLENDTVDIQNVNEARGVASAGVLVEYPWLARTQAASHIVTPMGQVIARTGLGDRQTELSNEDARSLVFDDTNLFEVDKFSGFDRVESGSRANVGLQYTFQADNGGYARLLAGQSFQLDNVNPFDNPGRTPTVNRSAGNVVTDDNPTFNDKSGLETRRSDYVLGAYLSPSQYFQLIGQARFDERDLTVKQADLFVRASYGPLFASATYGYADKEVVNLANTTTNQEEILGNVGLRLDEHWTAFAGMRFDIDETEVLQQSFGLRYADECLVLSATYTERNFNNVEEDLREDRTFMVRFDLKHLGQFQADASVDFEDPENDG